MGLSLTMAQTVAIGRFNPYIITPSWLVKCQVESDAGIDEIDDSDEPAEYNLGFPLGKFDWEVSLNRLAVSTDEKGLDCGAKVAAVIALLPHTPIEAVGNNYVFVCETSIWADRPTPQLGGGTSLEGMRESRWVGVFGESDFAVEVEMTLTPNEVVVIRLNYDRRTTPKSDAKNAATKFSQDYDHAVKLIKKLFHSDIV